MAKSKKKSTPPQLPPFEESMARLEQIVRELEDGQLGLNDSLRTFEEGVKCLQQCHQTLSDAERRVELLCDVKEDGTIEVRPLDLEEEQSLESKAESRSKRRTHRPATPDDDDEESGRLF